MTELLHNAYIFALGLAAVCTTAFPVIYAFSRWNEWLQGRALMQAGVSVAIAVDATLFLQLWPLESVNAALIVGTIIFGLLALSSLAMTAVMVHTNYLHAPQVLDLIEKDLNDNSNDDRDEPSAQ